MKKILKDILTVQQEAACLLGSDNVDNGCPASEDNTEEFDHGAAASGLYTAIQGSEFVSSLTGVKDAFRVFHRRVIITILCIFHMLMLI